MDISSSSKLQLSDPATPLDKRRDDGEYESSRFSKDVLENSIIDPVLSRKMELVNAAIDKIGMTPFQWRLFALNGFGYAVDSVSQILPSVFQFEQDLLYQLLVSLQSIAQSAVVAEYGSPNAQLASIPLASQIGLLVGAAFWGLSADIIGRRFAFNASLFLAAFFVIIAGAMPGYIPFATL
jgi:MFS family permease